jgi:uncharacterized protein involved in outer membrane biogenesis
MQIKTLHLGLKWRDLLKGNVNIKNLTIEQPNIHIMADQPARKKSLTAATKQGAVITKQSHTVHQADMKQSSGGPSTSAPQILNAAQPSNKAHSYPDIQIKRLNIHDATITYENPSKKIGYQLKHVDLDNSDFSLSQAGSTQQKIPWLHQITTNGRLQLGELWFGQWHLYQIDMHYNLTQGKLTLSPIHYNFNRTPGLASFIMYDTPEHIHLSLKNHLNDADLVYRSIEKTPDNKALAFATMPLLLDIESGKLSVNTHISADINDFSELDQKLNGSIHLSLKDGRINRFNLGYELQRLEDRINRIDHDPPLTKASTAFDEFSINMNIVNGKAKAFPVKLTSRDFRFTGMGDIDLTHQPAWLNMQVNIKPQPGRFKKLEETLNQYLGDVNQGSIPMAFIGPLYQPSKLAIKVDEAIAEKILNNFFASWPNAVKNKLITKLQGKLKKSLQKMQKRLNEGA